LKTSSSSDIKKKIKKRYKKGLVSLKKGFIFAALNISNEFVMLWEFKIFY